MVRTHHPGIYRRGGRYVIKFRDADGRQRQESARTLDAARRLKSARQADVHRGEFEVRSRVRFRDYALEWVERHQGRGRRGFRETTREDYRRDLQRYAVRYFGARYLAAITPRDVAGFVGWLCDEREQGRRLADGSVRRIVAPLRSCLATARREGLIRHNPADDVPLPRRIGESDDEREVRTFTREQLAAVLGQVHPRHRPMFRLLAATGLRWSEVVALRWRDLVVDGSEPHLRVRRALVRGRYGPPKSRHGRREVPLSADVARDLRERRSSDGWKPDDEAAADALAFPASNGAPLDHSNMMRRVLRPVAEEADAAWAGFHTFRHTFAALHIARGTNLLQLSRLLGHHSPAFTLDVYGHLMDGDRGAPLDLEAELAPSRPMPANPAPLPV